MAALAASFAFPAPAEAATRCVPLVQSGPGVEADIDGDGNPDYRVAPYHDVRLCVQADVVLYPQRQPLEVEHCAEWFNCIAVRVTVGFGGSADTGIALCYTVDGLPVCWGYDPGPVPVNAGPQTICVGYDRYGGHPCGNGQMFAFE